MKLAAPNLPFFQQIVVRGVLITVGVHSSGALGASGIHRPSGKDRALTARTFYRRDVQHDLLLTALFSIPLANLSADAILAAYRIVAAAIFFGEPVGGAVLSRLASGLLASRSLSAPAWTAGDIRCMVWQR
jgi:hypothetical protein